MIARGYAAVLALAGASALGGCTADAPAAEPPAAPAVAMSAAAAVVRAQWVADIEALGAELAALEADAATSTDDAASVDRVRARFRAVRLAYKRVEHLATYYEPTTSDLLNGPALLRVEEDEGPEVVFPPEGLQVVEALLYPEVDPATRDQLMAEVGNARELVTRLRTAAGAQPLTDDRVWEAARLQLARASTLGIGAFDAPVSGLWAAELRASLDAVQRTVDAFGEHAELTRAFDRARALLDSAPERRFALLQRGLVPLAHALRAARLVRGIGIPAERRVFTEHAASPYDAGAIDAYGFAPPGTVRATEAEVALGRRFFFDVRLSGDGTRSCASCHDPARAFTDGRARSLGRSGHAVPRNAPSVINAALANGTFADLRTAYLEDQVADVMRNPDEMHAPDASALVRSALAAYMRSLVRLDSRVDQAIRGNDAALTAVERRGFDVFMGAAKCGTCHFPPLYNGSVPPVYQETEVEVIGVPAKAHERLVSPDLGRHRVTRAEPHRHAFKTPTVRNVALTAPYMHNGVFRTLEEVVEFYDRGGGAGQGLVLPNQTLPPDPLNLTPAEKRALIAFMRALTDTTGLR